MLRDLQKDLKHLSSLAFRRSAHCASLLQKFHSLKTDIAATSDPGLIWNIYDWLRVPLSLWPLDFEGFRGSKVAGALTPSEPLQRFPACHLPFSTRPPLQNQEVSSQKACD